MYTFLFFTCVCVLFLGVMWDKNASTLCCFMHTILHQIFFQIKLTVNIINPNRLWAFLNPKLPFVNFNFYNSFSMFLSALNWIILKKVRRSRKTSPVILLLICLLREIKKWQKTKHWHFVACLAFGSGHFNFHQ